jgi:hypothetical protein
VSVVERVWPHHVRTVASFTPRTMRYLIQSSFNTSSSRTQFQ